MKQQALMLGGLLALVGACVIKGPAVLDAGGDGDGETGANPDDDSEDDGSEPTDTGNEPDVPDPDPDPGPTDGDGCAEAIDILVVLDNSGSMGDSQRQLTDAFPLLIEGLDQHGVDWRLAVTTTDNGNLWCPFEQHTPEAGGFVFSSCQTRLDDFVFSNEVDVQDYACNDVCNVGPEQLQALPTTTALDPNPQPRPWLQREAGQLNLQDGVAVGDALRCLLPQGVDGCGFEQQLESMRKALGHTTNADRPEAGFLRDDASLLVLLVTDEVDCSIRPEFEEAVFADDGNKAFWTDPTASFPTSAVCWNAGVECFGDPSGYDDCVAADKDVWGNPASPVNAVLYPMSRYQGVLSAIEQSKRAIDDGHDVAVLAINGVGLDGTFHYADVTDSDPDFQNSFGIGPGCTGPGDPGELSTGVPPVRIRQLAEHMSTDPFGSICAESYDAFMLDTVERFVGGC